MPVKNLIYDGTDAFYTLLYPEYRSASALQLYRFSIESGDYTLMGDTIPIRSEKIKTNANLFFYPPLNTFYTITQVFDSQEVASRITVYELKAPAVSHAELIQYDNSQHTGNTLSYVWLLVIPAAVFIGFWMVRIRARRKVATPPAGGQDEAAAPVVLPLKNALYLFGKFEAFDVKGANIAHLFSGRLPRPF